MRWPWSRREPTPDPDYIAKKQTVLSLSSEMECLAAELREKARHLQEEVSRGR